MKQLLLVLGLFVGAISYSQGVFITNNTNEVQYVRANFTMPDCSANTASPSGWIALAPNATLNIGGSNVNARLLHLNITGSSPGSSNILTLDNALSPCGTPPYSGLVVYNLPSGATCTADISTDGLDNYVNIHY
jgi:hypothetical protein